jgi:hypothetical protein
MVTDVNRMEYLLNTKRCYCRNLNEKKIVKEGNIMKTLARWLCNSYSMVKVLKRIDKN